MPRRSETKRRIGVRFVGVDQMAEAENVCRLVGQFGLSWPISEIERPMRSSGEGAARVS